jgi:hypothetical protein
MRTVVFWPVLLKKSEDQVRTPESWNIGPLVWIAVVLGLLMLIEALTLLAFGWRLFDLGHHDGRLQTFAFQTILFFAIFSILSVRERRAFWASPPSWILATALLRRCRGWAVGGWVWACGNEAAAGERDRAYRRLCLRVKCFLECQILTLASVNGHQDTFSPWENGYIESCNGKLRDELLNGEIF